MVIRSDSSIPSPLPSNFSRTKIVATVGPAVNGEHRLQELIEAGADVFRINTAHGTTEEHDQWLERIRQASERTGRLVATLVDLAGPKMRLKNIPQDPFDCEIGKTVRFVRGEATGRGELAVTYERLVDDLEVGNRVLLADGTVSLEVIAKHPDSVECRVVQPGRVRSRQGVNVPGARLQVSALTPQDQERVRWAAQRCVDFVGLSFVRQADDVKELRALLQQHGSSAQIVAKIEKPEAVENLKEIVEEADAVMVARGDLGVEIDIERVPLVQKQIIDTCHRQCKPVIVATQMLESMQHSQLPTRAEVTDVANAVLDGADACMLSGETAIGKYPVEAVRMMNRIVNAAESMGRGSVDHLWPNHRVSNVSEITQGICFAAGQLAEDLQAKALVVATASGRTALVLSKQRWSVPVIGISDSSTILRRMSLYWGVAPVPGPAGQSDAELLEYLRTRTGLSLKPGDRVVILWGTMASESRHNSLSVRVIH